MLKSANCSITTSRGSLSRLWQARSLFLGGEPRMDQLSPIKQVIVRKLRPLLESKNLSAAEMEEVSPGLNKMVPGLASGITTGLALLSDLDCLEGLLMVEGLIRETLDELQPLVESYAKSEQLATAEARAE